MSERYFSALAMIFCLERNSGSWSGSSIPSTSSVVDKFLETREATKGWSLAGKKPLGAEATKGKVRTN